VKFPKPISKITRRVFLKITGAVAFMGSIPSAMSGIFVKSLPVRTVEKTRFKFDAEKGVIEWENGSRQPYKLVVDGLVKASRSFSYADIRSFARVEQVSDFHCVEGWSVKDLKWGGFRFKEILERVEPDPRATHILFHSFGTTESSPKGQSHYIESMPLRELLDPAQQIIMALTLDGSPLPEAHGAPLRLITPYDLSYKGIKFVTRVEFIKGARPGWWTLANPIYTIEAKVPKNRLRS
jgi:DMSO/TMAO reductase YedYZ molybdopterin-dependent catalytic subunit